MEELHFPARPVQEPGSMRELFRTSVITGRPSHQTFRSAGGCVAGSHLLTDGFAAYRGRDAALGEHLTHTPVVQDDGANAGEFFPIIHTLFSNIKAWLVGTHHGVSAKHLPRYLREWSYRFNRRNLPDGLDGYLIRRAVECATITDDQLKTGTMPGGAHRIRRPPAAVAQPALAG